MKRIVLLCVFFLSACALFPHKVSHIRWPDNIEYLEALCELDMSWKNMKYSGSMSLIIEYPDKLHMEVYSPFGDTIVYLNRDRESFLSISEDERITEEKRFEEKFGIKLNDFIDDIVMKGYKNRMPGKSYIQRGYYRVIYTLSPDENKICWEGMDGRICMKFIEARFNREEAIGKGRNRGM